MNTPDSCPSRGQRDGGFTLVELLIVIVILGVLATVVVFSVRGATDGSERVACRDDQKLLQTAIEGYYALNGTLATVPPSEADLESAGLLHHESKYLTISAALPALVEVDTTVTGNPCEGTITSS